MACVTGVSNAFEIESASGLSEDDAAILRDRLLLSLSPVTHFLRKPCRCRCLHRTVGRTEYFGS